MTQRLRDDVLIVTAYLVWSSSARNPQGGFAFGVECPEDVYASISPSRHQSASELADALKRWMPHHGIYIVNALHAFGHFDEYVREVPCIYRRADAT